jgi:hypothetical protein
MKKDPAYSQMFQMQIKGIIDMKIKQANSNQNFSSNEKLLKSLNLSD